MRYIIFLLALGFVSCVNKPIPTMNATNFHNRLEGIEADTFNKKLYFYVAPGGQRFNQEVYDIFEWSKTGDHFMISVRTDSGLYIKASFFEKADRTGLWGIKY